MEFKEFYAASKAKIKKPTMQKINILICEGLPIKLVDPNHVS